jgi:phosphoserine phosphatase
MPDVQGQLQQDVLGRIMAVSKALGASADLIEILSLIIDAMRDTLEAERATVFEFDKAHNELFTTVAHGLSAARDSDSHTNVDSTPTEIRIPISSGLAGECATTRRIINVPDAYADRRFNQAIDRQTGYRTRSILTIPLIGHDGELVGVAQVLNRRGGPFRHEDENIAEALAAHAAIAMRRGRLIEDRMVREKLERDLQLARTIQQSSFPNHLPLMDVFDLAAWNRPADQTGGDVYDVIAHRSNEDGWQMLGTEPVERAVLLMADATGHGVGPALSVTQLRSMLRMAVRLGADLRQIARHANRQLSDDLPNGRFITAWMGLLDARSSTLTSFSAGQAPLIRYRAQQDEFDVSEADTVPLGVLPVLDPEIAEPMRFMPGDIFAVISDGVFEARGPGDELYGIDRALACLRAHHTQVSGDIIEALREDVQLFCAGQPPDDDQTAIIVRRRMT